jgi:uncharacterized repeat protein (TIGR03803 family)
MRPPFRRLAFHALSAALALSLAASAGAQTLTTLHSFGSRYPFVGADGEAPQAALVQAGDGNLYGTTSIGGANSTGTVFRISPSGVSGVFATLYSFSVDNQGKNPDGANPYAGLVQASDGNLYGTTYNGGANGAGTVFRISPSGAFSTLYNFCGQASCADGVNPEAGLVQAGDGYLYGTTSGGGGANYSGTVFRISPSGVFTTLYSFCAKANCADGANPRAGLVRASDGNLYGTTYFGGANGAGTVFRISPAGVFTTLHSFCAQANCADGANPRAGLVQASDGNLYGMTIHGGSSGLGTIFRLSLTGAFTTLYSFSSLSYTQGVFTNPDGAYPYGGLVQASDGDLYGTTYSGGSNGRGTIFRFSPLGVFTTLYSFCQQAGCADGADPQAGLIEASDGNLYGTTTGGGSGAVSGGTAFRLFLGLPPCGPDDTGSVTFARSGISYSFSLHVYGQTVTITNNGAPLAAGATLAVDSLPSGVTLANAAGATQCDTSSPVPYLTLTAPLGTGESVAVPLRFSDPARAPITYTLRLLATTASAAPPA